jgi:hypothetical protein
MKISKPVVNDAGMILLGEGTEITSALIAKLEKMNIASVNVEGSSAPDKSLEEMLTALDARFKKTENEPLMGMLKSILKEHIEGLYK